MIEFTGERVVPGQVEEDLWDEHFSRYVFAARLVAGKRVLDLGCGTGYGSAELGRDACMTVGLDVSPEAAGFAASHYASPKTHYLAATAVALPFPDASFDVVIAFEVIEHLADWEALLAEARRVVRSDGLVLISTPNKIYYAESRGTSGGNPFHQHEFEPRAFHDALAAFFPHTRILLQNRVHAFAFYSPADNAASGAQIAQKEVLPEDAHFLLAVCGLDTPPDLCNFIYVPRASNVLLARERHIESLQQELNEVRAERERHIESLQQELDEARSERDSALRSHEILTRDLDEKIRWAAKLDNQLAAAHRSHEALTADLDEKIQWATRLNDDLARARAAIDAAENTVIERTRWAQDLDAQLQTARQRLGDFEESRWVRLGRRLGLGPAPEASDPKKDG